MKWVLAVLTLMMLAACGDVEWFPSTSDGDAAFAPNNFTFPLKEVTQAVALSSGAKSQSDSVTVQGNNTAGWTVTVTDSTTGANSQFSVNGDTFSNTSRTILPNQTLQIQHVPSTVVGGQSTTTVKVGTFQTAFTTNTVANP